MRSTRATQEARRIATENLLPLEFEQDREGKVYFYGEKRDLERLQGLLKENGIESVFGNWGGKFVRVRD